VASVNCPACGREVTGNYCANCGQRTGTLVLSMRSLLRDVLEDQFVVNATLPRTLRALFFQPGFLTNEYLRQRISTYVPPFRLYLFASVFFFLLASLQAPPLEITPEDRVVLDSLRSAYRDSAAARTARGEAPPARRFGLSIDPMQENWADSATVNLGSERLNRIVRARLQAIGNLPPEMAFQRLTRSTIENTPKVMFLLLPLYALLLKLFYVRSGRYYVAHFIYGLYLHAFAFSVFLLMLLTNRLEAATVLLMVWLVVYSWLAQKRVYAEGWLKTTVKWSALHSLYGVVVALGLLVALLSAIFTICAPVESPQEFLRGRSAGSNSNRIPLIGCPSLPPAPRKQGIRPLCELEQFWRCPRIRLYEARRDQSHITVRVEADAALPAVAIGLDTRDVIHDEILQALDAVNRPVIDEDCAVRCGRSCWCKRDWCAEIARLPRCAAAIKRMRHAAERPAHAEPFRVHAETDTFANDEAGRAPQELQRLGRAAPHDLLPVPAVPEHRLGAGGPHVRGAPLRHTVHELVFDDDGRKLHGLWSECHDVEGIRSGG
jgi:hypothetical protein